MWARVRGWLGGGETGWSSSRDRVTPMVVGGYVSELPGWGPGYTPRVGVARRRGSRPELDPAVSTGPKVSLPGPYINDTAADLLTKVSRAEFFGEGLHLYHRHHEGISYVDAGKDELEEGGDVHSSKDDDAQEQEGEGEGEVNVAAYLRSIAFTGVVDEDTGRPFEGYVRRDLAGRLLESKLFHHSILAVIAANTVVIGLQTNATLAREHPNTFAALDTAFVAVFGIELGLKWVHDFRGFWDSPWNVFDFVVVAASILGELITSLGGGKALRILRVLRALRALRSIKFLSGLQTVVQTIALSVADMSNILILLALIMFIWSVVGVSIFARAAPRDFGDLPSSMFTLFVFLTQDGWVDIFHELQDAGYFAAAYAYCVSFIVLGAFVFMNLLVGIIVTNHQASAIESKAASRLKWAELKPKSSSHTAVEGPRRGAAGVDRVESDVWRRQQPLELPDLEEVTPAAVENYYLVLLAVEDNLVEFDRLRGELVDMSHDVQELNTRRGEGVKAPLSEMIFTSGSEAGGGGGGLSDDDDRDSGFITDGGAPSPRSPSHSGPSGSTRSTRASLSTRSMRKGTNEQPDVLSLLIERDKSSKDKDANEKEKLIAWMRSQFDDPFFTQDGSNNNTNKRPGSGRKRTRRRVTRG